MNSSNERRPGVGTEAAGTLAGGEVGSYCTSDAAKIAYVAAVSREIGYEAAMFAVLRAGRELSAEAARTVWVHPRFAEIAEKRRLDHEPCATKCRRCSRCIHSLSWYERGQRPYRGVAAEPRISVDWTRPADSLGTHSSRVVRGDR